MQLQLTTAVVLSFLGLVSAQGATLTLPNPGNVVSSIRGGATSAVSDIGSGIDQATSGVGSGISNIASDFSTATGPVASRVSTRLSSASSVLSSASSSATNSNNPAPIQTAAVGLGALLGGAAVLANL